MTPGSPVCVIAMEEGEDENVKMMMMKKKKRANVNKFILRDNRILLLISVILAVHLVACLYFLPLCMWYNSKSVHGGQAHRKLAFVADPQMEGKARVWRQGKFGQLNNDFNDLYVRYVARAIKQYAKPLQLFVLGDLFSSEHIADWEFEKRTERFRSIFEHSLHQRSARKDETGLATSYQINLAGNHDMGYGVHVTPYRYERFVRTFGVQQADYELHIGEHDDAKLWVAIVDSMCLDGTLDKRFHDDAWNHLEHLARKRDRHPQRPLLLMTHVPLLKPEGSCFDQPFTVMQAHAVVKQNFLSQNSTSFILDRIRPTMIFNGHDHVGCEFVHVNAMGEQVPEHTVRSVMGGYGGGASILEATHNANTGEISFHFYTCPFASTYYLVSTLVITAIWFIANCACLAFRRQYHRNGLKTIKEG